MDCAIRIGCIFVGAYPSGWQDLHLFASRAILSTDGQTRCVTRWLNAKQATSESQVVSFQLVADGTSVCLRCSACLLRVPVLMQVSVEMS